MAKCIGYSVEDFGKCGCGAGKEAAKKKKGSDADAFFTWLGIKLGIIDDPQDLMYANDVVQGFLDGMEKPFKLFDGAQLHLFEDSVHKKEEDARATDFWSWASPTVQKHVLGVVDEWADPDFYDLYKENPALTNDKCERFSRNNIDAYDIVFADGHGTTAQLSGKKKGGCGKFNSDFLFDPELPDYFSGDLCKDPPFGGTKCNFKSSNMRIGDLAPAHGQPSNLKLLILWMCHSLGCNGTQAMNAWYRAVGHAPSFGGPMEPGMQMIVGFFSNGKDWEYVDECGEDFADNLRAGMPVKEAWWSAINDWYFNMKGGVLSWGSNAQDAVDRRDYLTVSTKEKGNDECPSLYNLLEGGEIGVSVFAWDYHTG